MNKNFPSKEVYIQWFMDNDRLGALLGSVFVSLDDDACIFEYNTRPEHMNPNGILHGGALYGVMDSSQGLFVHHILDPGFRAAATGTATIKYLAPVRAGKITITTKLQRQEGRKLYIDSVALDETQKEVARLEEIWIAIL